MDGPAIIAEDLATTVVEPGWRASVTDRLDLLLTRVAPDSATTTRATTEADPVLLEVFGNLFMAVAEQMGERLRSTAHSVNIKERLDFSCAIFDADGGLIANAPHIPVHLGSMGESIKMVINRNRGRIKPGDVYALNDPYHGGTHLPDVTVVTPVFPAPVSRPRCSARHRARSPAATPPIRPRGSQGHNDDPPLGAPWFYVASRGHHAEIGGMSPGSMPAASTRIEQEGVLIDNWLLVENGRLREEETRHLLASAEYPSRNPDTNLADLRAQVAANEKGVEELRRMVGQYGLDVIRAYMRHIQENAAESVRNVIARLADGEFAYELDNRATIRVKVTVDKHARTATIDFTGTSPQLGDNFNAPVGRGDGGRAVRVPHARRQGHTAERRLPEAPERDHPARNDAEPAVPGRRGGGQRRDQPGGHRRPLRRAQRHGRGVGNDEQRDVRQRPVPVLRDGRQRLRRRRGVRRHRRGPDEDDELPADRPRGARMALPGPPRVLRDQARQRRRAAAGAAATAAPAGSGSSSR